MKPFLVLALLLSVFPQASVAQEEQDREDVTVTALATFGGGCFWCMEPPYDKLKGVLKTVSGFSGGDLPNPSYKQVSNGGTGHTEVVQVTYDPSVVSFEELLKIYWRNVDPLDDGGQFCDRGYTYRPVIFYHSESQRNLSEQSKARVLTEAAIEGENVTAVEAYSNFYAAEDYHQNYYKKSSRRYKYYRWRCGRDARLKQLWG